MACIEKEKFATAIAGCFLQPLAIIETQGGPVLHMLNQGYALMPYFPHGFGEIYFSEIYPASIKAWKRHRQQQQLFAVPAGRIRMAIYDGRPASSTEGELVALELGRPDHYSLLAIPPGLWYGFQCISATPALICNCANLPHDPGESEKLAQDSPLIPFSWQEQAG